LRPVEKCEGIGADAAMSVALSRYRRVLEGWSCPVTHAQAGTASGLNDVLLAAAAFAVLGATAGFAFGCDPASSPLPSPAAGTAASAEHANRPQTGPAARRETQ